MKAHNRPMIRLSGEPKAGEKELFTVAVGNVDPANPASVAAMEFITKLSGLAGIKPEFPRGTLLLFHTLDDAKAAFDALHKKRIATGTNICNCFVLESVLQAAKEKTEQVQQMMKESGTR